MTVRSSVVALLSQKKNAIAMGPLVKNKGREFVAEGVPVIKGGNLNAAFLDETILTSSQKKKQN